MPLLVVVIVLCACVAASDLHYRRVPNNWLLLGLAAGGVCMSVEWSMGQRGFPWWHLAGFVIGGAVMLPFYLLRWMGAGDVKFFAVLGFLLGAPALLPVWIAASLAAGAHAAWIVRRNLLVRRLHRVLEDESSAPAVLDKGRGTPYATCLAVAAMLVALFPALGNWTH